MSVSLEQFVQNLTASGLLSAAEITSFQQSLPAHRQPKDAETLARELVQAGKLTRYQAGAVYQGKTKGLVFGEYVVLDKLGQGGMGVLYISGTDVSDLSPLRGMPLTRLWCFYTKVTDLSPLKEMPLKELRCDFDPKRDTEILRSLKTLETINGLPVAEFWKQVEAGKSPLPGTGLGKQQEE